MIKSSVEFNNTEYHNTTIQLKHAPAADLAADNPILANGEMAIETDTNKFKFGDGETRYNALPYAGGGTGVAGSFKYGLYKLSANQATNLAVGNHIEFDTVQGSLPAPSLGSGQQRGIITLLAGQTYKLTGLLNADFLTPSAVAFSFYDRTNNILIGNAGSVVSVSVAYSNCGMQPTVSAVVYAATDIEIDLRIISIAGGSPDIMEYTSTSVLVEEYGGY